MTTINDGGPAFPAKVSINRDSGELRPHQFGNDDFCTPGLSLRDYFAAKAMQAQLTAFWAMETHHGWSHDEIAREAYAMADAMLMARGEINVRE